MQIDDIALLSRSPSEVQPPPLGFKVLQKNVKVAEAISIDGLEDEEVNHFVYLVASVHGAGGSYK